MKVTHVSTWQTACGIAGYTEDLCGALQERGVECMVTPIDRDYTEHLSRAELRSHFERLAATLAEADADVVHIQHEFGFFAGAYNYAASLANFRRVAQVLRSRHVPTLVTLHTDAYWFERWTGKPLDHARQLGAKTLWRARTAGLFTGRGGLHVLTHSRDTRRRMVDAGIPPERIEVIRQGVREIAGEADRDRRRAASARAWLGIPAHAPVLAMVGFVAPYKGHATAIEALRSLPPDYHLLIVGGAPSRGEELAFDAVLDVARRDEDLAGRITVTGYLDAAALEECVAATDIFLLPYTTYPRLSSSAALSWAIASGKPVIASRIPAFADLAEAAGCVEVVTPGAPRELALAAQVLYGDRARREQLRGAAQRFCAAQSWAVVAERHERLYERIRDCTPGRRHHRARSTGIPVIPRHRVPASGDSILLTTPPPAAALLSDSQFAHIEAPGCPPFWLADDGQEDPVVEAMKALALSEDPVWQLAMHLTSPGTVVVDVGAHVGTFALPLASVGARVLAVEASPHNARLLRAAAVRNHFDHLEVALAAAGDRADIVSFAAHGPWGSVVAEPGGNASTLPPRLDVPQAAIDALLADRGIERVDLVKLDIEGSETRAIRGMRRLLSGPEPPMLIVECNAYALDGQGSTPAELLGEIEAYGYRLLQIDYDEPGRLVPARPSDVQPRAVVDYLALHRRHDVAPPWRIEPFTGADISGRLIIQARSDHPAYRAYAAQKLRSLADDSPAVELALEQLAQDANVGVRAAARDGNGGPEHPRPRARRARKPFDAGGHPTFSLVASLDGSGGYGYSAEQLALAATRQGAEIGWVVQSTVDDRFTAPAVRALEIPRHQHADYEVMVIYSAPYSWTSLRAPTTIGMTMFETTELPDSWVAQCEQTDGLIVPSAFNREVFSHKLTVPIEVVPLGVNPQHYPELERPEPEIFTFLMVGGLSPRKAPDIAVRAFEQEFRRHEAVRLVLKTYRNTLDWNGYAPSDRRVHVVDGDADRRRMLELYRDADCLVACSRGEASGLTPREAMSTGIPAIVTDWGGLRELANPDCVFVLETEGEEPAFGASFPFGVTGGSPIGSFASPSVDHLAALMRRAYEDRDATRAMGQRAAAWMREEWNYDRCAQRWLEATARLVAGKCGAPSG